jgi:hypothetical protein
MDALSLPTFFHLIHEFATANEEVEFLPAAPDKAGRTGHSADHDSGSPERKLELSRMAHCAH